MCVPASLAHLRMEVTSLPFCVRHTPLRPAALSPSTFRLVFTPHRYAVAVAALSGIWKSTVYTCSHTPHTNRHRPNTHRTNTPRSTHTLNTHAQHTLHQHTPHQDTPHQHTPLNTHAQHTPLNTHRTNTRCTNTRHSTHTLGLNT